MAVNPRIKDAPFALYVSNQAASRVHRRETLQLAKKGGADFEGLDADVVLKRAEQIAEHMENRFIEAVCDDDSFPNFDFDINAHDLE